MATHSSFLQKSKTGVWQRLQWKGLQEVGQAEHTDAWVFIDHAVQAQWLWRPGLSYCSMWNQFPAQGSNLPLYCKADLATGPPESYTFLYL